MDSRHPLVIVLVIAVIGIGYYYFASPFESGCFQCSEIASA